nr:hypothetical protein [Dendronalium sp. ChiSLP03b]MDZ8204269.1 hypothetical protein [Dendronalium sp. ChiSLP03b]
MTSLLLGLLGETLRVACFPARVQQRQGRTPNGFPGLFAQARSRRVASGIQDCDCLTALHLRTQLLQPRSD